MSTINFSNHLATLVLLWLSPQLAAAVPTPTGAPGTNLIKRNNAGVPTSAAGVTQMNPQQQQQSSDATASLTSSSARATTTSGTGNLGYGTFFGSGLPSNFLTWISVIVIVGIMVALLVARYFYIRRFYPVTLRAYCIPSRGLHVNWLKLHIKGPPPRRPPPPTYGLAVMEGRRNRTRRDRTTRGETIGEGGARRGDRDMDDEFDGEAGLAGDALPMYELDTSLPAYVAPAAGDVAAVADRSAAALERDGTANAHGQVHSDADGTDVTAAGIPVTSATDADDEQLPSVQDYEQQTRARRDVAAETVAPSTSSTASPPTSTSTTFGIPRPAILARLSSRVSAATPIPPTSPGLGAVADPLATASIARPSGPNRSASHPQPHTPARPSTTPLATEDASTRSLSSSSTTSGTSSGRGVKKPSDALNLGDGHPDRRKEEDETNVKEEEDGVSSEEDGAAIGPEIAERRTPEAPPSVSSPAPPASS